MHSTESRFVTGPSNTLFTGAYVGTFQPGNFLLAGAVKGLTLFAHETKLSPVETKEDGKQSAKQERNWEWVSSLFWKIHNMSINQ